MNFGGKIMNSCGGRNERYGGGKVQVAGNETQIRERESMRCIGRFGDR